MMQLKPQTIVTLTPINFFLFFVGMVGVWGVTHSAAALFWTFVASIHLTIRGK